MATTPVTAKVTVEKEVSLPHMPPRPEEAPAPTPESTLPESTRLEQEAGKRAVAEAKKRTEEEQAAGRKAVEQAEAASKKAE